MECISFSSILLVTRHLSLSQGLMAQLAEFRVNEANLIKRLARSPLLIIKIIICKLRTCYYSRFIDQGKGKIVVTDPFLRIRIRKGKNARIICHGKLRIVSHIGGTAPVRIYLGENSQLKIGGDFSIGHGVRIFLKKNAELSFGGKLNESDSGITSDTLIMVEKKVSIGRDFLCAWNVFISDSDWHHVEPFPFQKDVVIGDHVWIAHECSVLKGSRIGHNSIVSSHSKVINRKHKPDSMLAGSPAKAIWSGVKWSRDADQGQDQ